MNRYLPICRHFVTALCAVVALVLSTGACATLGGPIAGMGSVVPYPAWVKEGSRLAVIGQDKMVMGVGAVRGIRNVALARSTADNRARAELTRLLDGFVAAWAMHAPGDQGAHKEVLSRLLLACSLGGVQIVEHYFHPDDGSVYSLAQLNLSHVVQSMQGRAELTGAVKKYLADTSNDAYNRMLRGRSASAISP